MESKQRIGRDTSKKPFKIQEWTFFSAQKQFFWWSLGRAEEQTLVIVKLIYQSDESPGLK